ncbi:MAG: 7-cyano-7-deazaguanine synthase QueC [Rhodobiaceae bacterium]|jgi:7-cyano-7-deazaguanine synthase|nr:7-cyano-7-deazaguanine synthase QueC [Rhodobiaceae bacterium]
MKDTSTALVLFSGGQDSTACLAYALDNFAHVETLGFDYGQTHRIELDCRARLRQEIAKISDWGPRLGEDHTLALPALAEIGGTALIASGSDSHDMKKTKNNLPATFVPGRNLLFLTYAAALAYRRGLNVLVGGMCETDYSGYPDCRRDTLDALEASLNLGMETHITIDTPLMHIDKAETWEMAAQLGGEALVELTLEHSHTCYRGQREHRHDWGYGCNDCPACELRAAGYTKWSATHDL